MRKLIIAGNWKMNGTITEATILTEAIKNDLEKSQAACDVVLCPPFTALTSVADLLDGESIQLGAQTMHYIDKGAYTGEVSPVMLSEIGCNYVIIGHSERRAYYNETDEAIKEKLQAAFRYGMTPILCVGESLSQREKHETMDWIGHQLEADISHLPAKQVEQMVIAYEPIWAIGTGKTATAAQAQEVCSFIRQKVEELFSPEVAQAIRIQYGGSVKANNAKEILSQPDIDGALVGGAALVADEFMAIIKAC